MKKYFVLSMLTLSSLSCTPNRSEAAASNEVTNTDSASINQSGKQASASKAKELETYFIKKDDSGQTLVQSKEIESNGNGVYIYFYIKNDKAVNLRLHIQFWQGNYSAADQYEFDVDGNKYLYDANRNEWKDGGERITEGFTYYWYDKNVNKTDLNFLKALADSEKATVSIVDRGMKKAVGTVTFTENQKKAIQHTLDYYSALDGATIPRKGMVNIRQ